MSLFFAIYEYDDSSPVASWHVNARNNAHQILTLESQWKWYIFLEWFNEYSKIGHLFSSQTAFWKLWNREVDIFRHRD